MATLYKDTKEKEIIYQLPRSQFTSLFFLNSIMCTSEVLKFNKDLIHFVKCELENRLHSAILDKTPGIKKK